MEKLNPEIIKQALVLLHELANEEEGVKEGFAPAADIKAAQGMPPGMPPGMDPAMMGMPPGMDPAMMGAPMPPAPPMPPGPPVPPAPPAPPAPPPPEAGAGGPPPEGGGEGQVVQLNAEDLMEMFQLIAAEMSKGGPNEGASTLSVGKRIDALEEKLDQVLNIVGGEPGSEPPIGDVPPSDAGSEPPIDSVPPGLEDALAGAPPAAMGAPMDAGAAAGQPMPMVPGGGMVASAAAGMDKASKAQAISELAAQLRKA